MAYSASIFAGMYKGHVNIEHCIFSCNCELVVYVLQ